MVYISHSIYFNSIKVRLELSLSQCKLRVRFYFNSIKVRLEPIHTLRNRYKTIPFQFHKGTIRTYEEVGSNNTPRRFQFHKGTIRTLLPHFIIILFLHFNSIKVRLELLNAAIQLKFISNFNSIKVRLERLYWLFVLTHHKFQFHKGTIRTALLFNLLDNMGISIP